MSELLADVIDNTRMERMFLEEAQAELVMRRLPVALARVREALGQSR